MLLVSLCVFVFGVFGVLVFLMNRSSINQSPPGNHSELLERMRRLP